MCSFADRLPQSEKRDTSKDFCPKESASFASRLSFSWFTSMAILGWRKPLTVTDLWQIRDADKSLTIHSSFDKHWQSFKSKANNNWDHFSQTNGNGVKSEDNGIKINGNHNENNYTKRQTSQMSSKSAKMSKTRRPGILRTMTKAFWFYFLAGALFKLFNDVLMFINPQIMK